MNYFKLLLCALLAIPSASFAMQEPIEPQPQIDRHLQLLINAGINRDAQCIGQCGKKAHSLAGNSLCITGCCWKFICSHDAAKIENQQCLFCHKKFSVHKTLLSNENYSFRFIDANGVENEITRFDEVHALRQCSTIKDSCSDANGIATYSHSFLTKDNLKHLAHYIIDPTIICKQPKLFNMTMLKVADFCGAPENILFELSNLLWMDLQDKENDSDELKEEKGILRIIAEQYLHCPAYLARFITEENTNAITHGMFNGPVAHQVIVNLSHLKLVRIFENGWVTDEIGQRYNMHHTFKTTKGLTACLREIFGNRANHRLRYYGISLVGHDLQTFTLSEYQRLKDTFPNDRTPLGFPQPAALYINLTGNKIRELCADQLDLMACENCQHDRCHNTTIQLILKNNLIDNVNDNVFDKMASLRCLKKNNNYGIDITIDLQNNLLTDVQKTEIQTKWNKAINTLPERMYGQSENGLMPRFNKVKPYFSVIAWSGLGIYLGYKYHNTPLEMMTLSGTMAGSFTSAILHKMQLNPPEDFRPPERLGIMATPVLSMSIGPALIRKYINNTSFTSMIREILRTPETQESQRSFAEGIKEVGAFIGGLVTGPALALGAHYLKKAAIFALARMNHPKIKNYDAIWNANKPKLVL